MLAGKWPRPNEIRRISKIEIWKGNVIDSVRITYETSSGTIGPITHGGDGGDPASATEFKLDLDREFVYFLVFKFVHSLGITANQTITAVYGRRLNDTPPPPEDYGKHWYVAWIYLTQFNSNQSGFVIQHSPVVVRGRNHGA